MIKVKINVIIMLIIKLMLITQMIIIIVLLILELRSVYKYANRKERASMTLMMKSSL